MTRTISRWAEDAGDTVQYACNLSGLVFAFSECVADLALEAEKLGKPVRWLNRHPICILWADKLDDVSRSRSLPAVPCSENLVDLAPQFAETMRRVCNEAREAGQGTDWRNQHPDAQTFVRKLVYVTGSREGLNVFRAFDACERLLKGEDVESDTG